MSVEPSLSDPHRGRRTVMTLTFASGQKLVYKPKDLGMEQSYYRLLSWFNERNVPLPNRQGAPRMQPAAVGQRGSRRPGELYRQRAGIGRIRPPGLRLEHHRLAVVKLGAQFVRR